MTTEIDGNSSRSDITSIDDTDSPYTTQGEGTISVDTSSGAVTVTLASADVKSGQPIEIYDSGNNASSNNITINTEGSESINPGGASSITLDTDGTYREIKSDGSNWFAQVNAQRDVVSTDEATITNNTAIRAYLSTDQSISTGSYEQVSYDLTAIDRRGEFDTTSGEATVDKDGLYVITCSSRFLVGNSGDGLSQRIRAAGSAVQEDLTQGADGGNVDVNSQVITELTSGDVVKVTVQNNDSDDTIASGERITNISIARIA